MGRVKRKVPAETDVRAAGVPATQGGASFFDLFGLRQGTSDFTQPYAQNPWVYATIRAIARNLKGVPVVVKQGKPEDRIPVGDRARAMRRKNTRADTTQDQVEDDGSVVVDQNNETVRLFRRPNPLMSRAKLWEHTAINLWNSGACVWAKVGPGGSFVTTQNMHPVELWPLPGTQFEPEIDQKTMLVTKWRGPWGGRQIEFLPHQLVWFTFASPYDILKGLPPMKPLGVSAEADFRANRHNANFFQNGAHLGGIIKTKANLGTPQVNQIREVWNDQHQGTDKAHRIAILTGDSEWIPNAASHKDMEFDLLRERARREITSGLGPVPPLLLGLSDDYTRATALEAKGVLFENTLLPEMQDIEDVLEVEVGNWTKGKYWIEFDLTKVEALRDNTADKADAATKFFAMGLTLEQVNAKLELGFDTKGMPHAKESFLPGTLKLADDVVAGIDALGLMDPEQGGGGAPTQPPGKAKADDTGAAGQPGGGPPRAASAPSREDDPDVRAARENRWRGFVRSVLDPVEAKTLSKVKRYVFALRKWTLDRAQEVLSLHLGTHRDENKADSVPMRLTRAMVEMMLFNEEEWDKELRRIMGPMYRASAAASLKHLQGELGKDIHVIAAEDPRVLDLMARKELKVVQVNDTIRERIRETLIRTLTNTETTTQTAAELQLTVGDDLKSEFNSLSGRALTIARTETAQVANEVRATGMKAAGIVQHEWLSAQDGHVRESHQKVNGERRVIGQAFSNGLTNPGQIGAPPEEVINCRCVCVAVVEGPPT